MTVSESETDLTDSLSESEKPIPYIRNSKLQGIIEGDKAFPLGGTMEKWGLAPEQTSESEEITKSDLSASEDLEAHESDLQGISDIDIPLKRDPNVLLPGQARESRRFNHLRKHDHLERRQQEDLQFFKKREREYYANIDLVAKAYGDNKYSQVQKELFKLISEKVDQNGEAGRDRAKLFVSKLRTHLESQVGELKIDTATITKIEQLFLNRTYASDREIATLNAEAEFYIGEKLTSTITTVQDPQYIPTEHNTFRQQPISYKDYEDYLIDKYCKINNEQFFPTTEYDDSVEQVRERNETFYGTGKAQYMDQYSTAINDRRETLTELLGMDNVQYSYDIFQLKDLYRSQGYEGLDQELKSFELILESLQGESSTLQARLDAQYAELAKLKGLNHEMNPQQEENVFDKKTSERMSGREKAEHAADLQRKDEVLEMATEEIIAELYEQFKATRRTMQANIAVRQDLIQSIKEIKSLLNIVTQKKTALEHSLANDAAAHAGDMAPGGVADIQTYFSNIDTEAQLESFMELFKSRGDGMKLNQSNNRIENFNTELDLLVRGYLLSKPGQEQHKLTGFHMLFNLMHKEGVKPDLSTHHRIFEYAVISNNHSLANAKLKNIVIDSQSTKFEQIHPQILEKFYKQCLVTDNFAGLGHLINYAEKVDLNTASWPLLKFQSALDFYLNQSFDLSKVMTFTRYYTHINQSRLEAVLEKEFNSMPIDKLSQKEKKYLHAKVFTESDKLIDMQSLFGHLVEKVGQQDIVDPFTKQDVLWSLIDFFTRRGMASLLDKGRTNYSSLAERDIAKYFENHIDSSKAFERITTVVLRFDKQSESFPNHIIQVLREYQTRNKGSLPFSFEPPKAKAAYYKLRNSLTGNKKISEKTLEYFMEMFQGLKMWPEIVDACHNFELITGVSNEGCELTQQYLAGAILNMPKFDSNKKRYEEIVNESVFQGKQNLVTPSYITNMTKAYLKDGSIPFAVKFFGDSVRRLSEVKQIREDYLVKMFDQVFGKEETEQMTLNKFKNRYALAIQKSEQALREARAFTSLREAIQDKNYVSIDAILKLYLVVTEERQLLHDISGGNMNDVFDLEAMDIEQIREIKEELMNEKQWQRLENVKDRKKALQELVKVQDYERILEIRDLMGERKFEDITGLEGMSPQDIADAFKVYNKREVIDMLDSAMGWYQAAHQVTDSSAMNTMQQFRDKVEELNKEDDEFFYPEPLTYTPGVNQSKQMQEDLSLFAESALDAARQDELPDHEFYQMRAEEAKQVPSRTKGTEEEAFRSQFHAELISAIKKLKEEQIMQGTTPELMSKVDQETKEWAKQREIAKELMKDTQIVNLNDNFQTHLIDDKKNNAHLPLALSYAQDQEMLASGDPSTKYRLRVSKNEPTQGALTEKEFQRLIEQKTGVFPPEEAENDFHQLTTPVGLLIGDGETYRRRLGKEILPKLTVSQIETLIRVKEADLQSELTAEDIEVLEKLRAREFSVITGSSPQIYLDYMQELREEKKEQILSQKEKLVLSYLKFKNRPRYENSPGESAGSSTEFEYRSSLSDGQTTRLINEVEAAIDGPHFELRLSDEESEISSAEIEGDEALAKIQEEQEQEEDEVEESTGEEFSELELQTKTEEESEGLVDLELIPEFAKNMSVQQLEDLLQKAKIRKENNPLETEIEENEYADPLYKDIMGLSLNEESESKSQTSSSTSEIETTLENNSKMATSYASVQLNNDNNKTKQKNQQIEVKLNGIKTNLEAAIQDEILKSVIASFNEESLEAGENGLLSSEIEVDQSEMKGADNNSLKNLDVLQKRLNKPYKVNNQVSNLEDDYLVKAKSGENLITESSSSETSSGLSETSSDIEEALPRQGHSSEDEKLELTGMSGLNSSEEDSMEVANEQLKEMVKYESTLTGEKHSKITRLIRPVVFDEVEASEELEVKQGFSDIDEEKTAHKTFLVAAEDSSQSSSEIESSEEQEALSGQEGLEGEMLAEAQVFELWDKQEQEKYARKYTDSHDENEELNDGFKNSSTIQFTQDFEDQPLPIQLLAKEGEIDEFYANNAHRQSSTEGDLPFKREYDQRRKDRKNQLLAMQNLTNPAQQDQVDTTDFENEYFQGIINDLVSGDEQDIDLAAIKNLSQPELDLLKEKFLGSQDDTSEAENWGPFQKIRDNLYQLKKQSGQLEDPTPLMNQRYVDKMANNFRFEENSELIDNIVDQDLEQSEGTDSFSEESESEVNYKISDLFKKLAMKLQDNPPLDPSQRDAYVDSLDDKTKMEYLELEAQLQEIQEEADELIANHRESVIDAYEEKYKMVVTDALIAEFAAQPSWSDEQISNLEQFRGTSIDIRDLLLKSLTPQEQNQRDFFKESNPSDVIINSQIFESGMIDDPLDPIARQKSYHDDSLVDMGQELLEAVNTRRQDVLALTVGIFNKMQDKIFPKQKLSKLHTFEPETGAAHDSKGTEVAITESLELMNKLLTDSRSPICSVLQSFGTYTQDEIDVTFGELYKKYGNEIFTETFDLQHELNAQQHLVAMNEKLKMMQHGLHALNRRILKEQELFSDRLKKEEEKQDQEEKDQQMEEHVDFEAEQAYNEYLQSLKSGKTVNKLVELPREVKLQLLSDLFTYEFQSSLKNSRTPNQSQFLGNIFPSYYAQDLISFGLQHDIPEAVRLGEQMMSQNDYQISEQMAKAVREYKFNNQDRYRKAMKSTGPIDDTSLYRKVANKSSQNPNQNSVWIGDYNAYKTLVESTYKRSEAWRRPSKMTWNYKPMGLMSEIMPKHLTEDYVKKQQAYINSIF